MRRFLLASLLLTMIALPAAAGHTPSCQSVTTGSGPTRVSASWYLYVWVESNGALGIQEVPCTGAAGIHHPADTLLVLPNCSYTPSTGTQCLL